MTKRILIRCDAAPEIGFGHVVRCLALADELRDQLGCEVSFAMLQGPQGVEQVQESGYLVHQPQVDSLRLLNEGRWLQRLVSHIATQVLVLDVRTNLAVEAIQQIRAQGVLIVTIDDPSDCRLAADIAFYPPVPQVERLDWTGFTGKRYVGWEWVLLRPQFARYRDQIVNKAVDGRGNKDSSLPLTILVTMGGSDPGGLTLIALKALDPIEQDLHVIVVLGRGYIHESALQHWLRQARRTYDLRRDVRDMPDIMAQADLAIASFGVTAYELAVLGVPATYLCLTDDHSESALAFCDAGIAVSLGKYRSDTEVAIRRTVITFIENQNTRLKMSFNAKNLVDGLGCARIAEKVIANESGARR